LTKPARDGRDAPFSDWLRKHPELDSWDQSLYLCDIDFSFHKWKTKVDKIGTRDVKLMLDLEIKTYGAVPNQGQLELLFFKDQICDKARRYKLFSNRLRQKVTVWHLGFYVLILNGGDRPDNCKSIDWCFFDNTGVLIFNRINEQTLSNILNFSISPKKFKKLTLRRKHGTNEVGFIDNSTDLLFPIARTIVCRY
jgi:hypothetical protein